MPKHEQTISPVNPDTETTLAISYQAFKDLNWDILFAGEYKLLAQTIKKWNSNRQDVIVSVNGSELSVTSEMIKDELVDITGKNKKNVQAFIQAFETARNNITTEKAAINKQAIIELRSATEIAVKQDIQEAEEIDQAMNLSGSNLYVTYGIMAINVLMFVLMAINGAGIIETNGLIHIKWGSNYSPLTLSGDWWRLVTNVFIHFGIIHLVMNMYCLYIVGVYLEPMLGKTKYITAYLCTGVLASLVSLWWHKEGVNSAGASGAIFGLYGLFLALLTTKLIPERVRKMQLQSIGIFVAYNLIYGLKGGVDNSAHIGGLISGFVVGYLYAIHIKKEKQEQKASWVLPMILIVTIGATAAYLSNHKESAENRNKALTEVKAADYKGNEKFNDLFNEMVKLQDEAIAVYKKEITDEMLVKELSETSMPLWNQAELVAKQMQGLDISPDMHKKADAVLEYVELRRKEITLITDIIVNKSVIGEHQLGLVRKKMEEVLEKFD